MRRLIYIIILLVIAGCGYSTSQLATLDEAQRLMQTDPSAALLKLNSIDVSEFHDSAMIARWALLYSEAMIVNHYSTPKDTIINIAIDYYGYHNLLDEYQKALRIKALNKLENNTDELASAIYLQKEKEFLLYKERVKREQYAYIGIFVLLFAAGIIIWMRQRLRLQYIKNVALMAEASSLKSQIDDNRGAINSLESKLHGLLENRFELIDSLCQTYYETQGTRAERKALIDKVKSEIESVRNDSFSQMEKTINDCRDNILVKVKDSFPELKPEDYQLLVYLASGLSTRTISFLLDESVDVVYKRKSRLKFRLKENVAPIYPEILSVF